MMLFFVVVVVVVSSFVNVLMYMVNVMVHSAVFKCEQKRKNICSKNVNNKAITITRGYMYQLIVLDEL
jgi:hypothetical protein